jgi:hypothetical protein
MQKQHTGLPNEGIGASNAAGLPTPCRYFPIGQGRYEVKPGLFAFGTDFGNGSADGKLIQIDDQYAAYRREKLAARAESLTKYYQGGRMNPVLIHRIAEFLTRRAATEHPEHFRLKEDTGAMLECRLSGEILLFEPDWTLRAVQGGEPTVQPPYVDAFDALACQLQDDIAVVDFDPKGVDRLLALHLCLPNYWAAEDKIGRDFGEIHAPVPGMTETYRRPERVIRAMSDKGPCVRFAWGLTTDRRLNHHPRPAPGVDPKHWQGRCFDPRHPRLYLRVERQVLWGLGDAALFFIRTYITDCNTLKPDERHRLHAAVAGMTEKELRYKGLAGSRDAVLRWLQASASDDAPNADHPA